MLGLSGRIPPPALPPGSLPPLQDRRPTTAKMARPLFHNPDLAMIPRLKLEPFVRATPIGGSSKGPWAHTAQDTDQGVGGTADRKGAIEPNLEGRPVAAGARSALAPADSAKQVGLPFGAIRPEAAMTPPPSRSK